MLFISMSALIILNCLFMMVSMNPVHSILFLVLVFLLVNILFMLLNLDFLALMMLIMYVGALMMLFLFMMMMLNIKMIEVSLFKDKSQMPMGMLMGLIFLIEMFIMLFNIFFDNSNIITMSDNVNHINMNFFLMNYFNYFKMFSNMEMLGSLLYNSLFFFFLLGSLILLLAMIAAMALTLKKKKNMYSQKMFMQLLSDFNKTIK